MISSSLCEQRTGTKYRSQGVRKRFSSAFIVHETTPKVGQYLKISGEFLVKRNLFSNYFQNEFTSLTVLHVPMRDVHLMVKVQILHLLTSHTYFMYIYDKSHMTQMSILLSPSDKAYVMDCIRYENQDPQRIGILPEEKLQRNRSSQVS